MWRSQVRWLNAKPLSIKQRWLCTKVESKKSSRFFYPSVLGGTAIAYGIVHQFYPAYDPVTLGKQFYYGTPQKTQIVEEEGNFNLESIPDEDLITEAKKRLTPSNVKKLEPTFRKILHIKRVNSLDKTKIQNDGKRKIEEVKQEAVEEADRAEKVKRVEKENQERAQKERVEKERVEKERVEKERVEEQRVEEQRVEEQRVEEQRVEKEQERIQKENLEKEQRLRVEKEKALEKAVALEKTVALKNEKIEKQMEKREKMVSENERVLKELLSELGGLEVNQKGSSTEMKKELLNKAKEHCEKVQQDVQKNVLSNVEKLDAPALRVKVVELATELKNQTLIESLKMVNALSKVEEEAAMKANELMQKQGELHDRVLEQQLKVQQEKYEATMKSMVAELYKKFEVNLNAALKQQGELLENAYKEKLDNERTQNEKDCKERETVFLNEMITKQENESNERMKSLREIHLKLKALQQVVNGRAVYDKFSHQVHKVSAAGLLLCNKVETSKPLNQEINALREAGDGDDLIEAVLEALPTRVYNQGAETVLELHHKFKNVRTNCREAALTPEKEGVVSHVLGKFYAKITIQPEGLVTGNGVEAVLARAESYLLTNDLQSAVAELETLPSRPASVASDWLSSARDRILLEQAASCIKAHVTLLAKSCS